MRNRPPSRGHGVELLEVDANSTAFSANESSALVAQSVSVDDAVPAPLLKVGV